MAICVSGESGDSVAPVAMQNNSSPPPLALEPTTASRTPPPTHGGPGRVWYDPVQTNEGHPMISHPRGFTYMCLRSARGAPDMHRADSAAAPYGMSGTRTRMVCKAGDTRGKLSASDAPHENCMYDAATTPARGASWRRDARMAQLRSPRRTCDERDDKSEPQTQL